METLGICIFLGCALLSLSLLSFRETKEQKRIWKYRCDVLKEFEEIKVHIKTIADCFDELNEHEVRPYVKKEK